MTPENKLPIPVEIPWQLASTTRTLLASSPLPADTTAISLFTYLPDLPNLNTDYPDERLVYLKFTVSVSPFAPAVSGEATPELLLGTKFPIWGMLFDVKINETAAGIEPPTNRPRPTDTTRPYFLGAAPTRRTMTETGVVGDQVFEGGSDQLAVGKSGSQLHETFNSKTKTSEFGIQLPLVIGRTSSSTSITGGRDVVESLDTTNRQASEERRELLSHLTNVNNILTLLTASLVGSPHLRFLLWPVPLRQLSVDPSDPNLWYSEFIKRRSSGIEGMQDFYAIAVVPRTAVGFCVDADLRRVFIIEPSLPQAPELAFEIFDSGNREHWSRTREYLDRRYPPGTPLDELDIDIAEPMAIPPLEVPLTRDDVSLDTLQEWHNSVGDIITPNPFLPPPDPPHYNDNVARWIKHVGDILAPNRIPDVPPSRPDDVLLIVWYQTAKKVLEKVQRLPNIQSIPRPVVHAWLPDEVDRVITRALNVTLNALTQPPSGPFVYKWATEVWLEMKRAEYQEELTRSPLLRGQPALSPMRLRTCFSTNTEGELTVLPPPRVNPASFFNVHLIASSLNPSVSGSNSELRNPGREAVFAWNALDTQLAARLSSFQEEEARKFRFDDDSILNLFLRSAENLAANDKANQSLDDVLGWIKLPAAHIKTLRRMNITNLRELAAAINLTLAAERRNQRLSGQLTRTEKPPPPAYEMKSRSARQKPGQTTPEPVALSADDAAEIGRAIGKGLQALYEKNSPSPSPEPTSSYKRRSPKRQSRPRTRRKSD